MILLLILGLLIVAGGVVLLRNAAFALDLFGGSLAVVCGVLIAVIAVLTLAGK